MATSPNIPSGWRESNPRVNLGKVAGCHYITPAHAGRGPRSPRSRPAPYNRRPERLVAAANRAGVTWIYAIPAWLFMIGLGHRRVRARMRRARLHAARITRNERITHNDVAGPILTIIGTVLAVMMSFMVVGVWQEYDTAAQTAQTEASALVGSPSPRGCLPEPSARVCKARVDRYITRRRRDEWPSMRHGGESLEAHDDSVRYRSDCRRVAPAQCGRPSAADASANVWPARFWTPGAAAFTTTAKASRSSFGPRCCSPAGNRRVFILFSRRSSAGAVPDGPRLDGGDRRHFSLIAELDYPFRGDIAVDAVLVCCTLMHSIARTSSHAIVCRPEC